MPFDLTGGRVFKLCLPQFDPAYLLKHRQSPVHGIHTCRKLCLDIFDALLGSILLVGVDLCCNLPVLLIYQYFGDQRVFADPVFQLFRGNIFPIAQNNQVLLAACDIQEICLLYTSDAADD